MLKCGCRVGFLTHGRDVSHGDRHPWEKGGGWEIGAWSMLPYSPLPIGSDKADGQSRGDSVGWNQSGK